MPDMAVFAICQYFALPNEQKGMNELEATRRCVSNSLEAILFEPVYAYVTTQNGLERAV